MSAQIQTVPRLVVELDGEPLSLEEMRTLWAVRVQQRLSLPTLSELIFIEPAVSLSKAENVLPGAKFRVTVPGFDEPLFDGEVTAIEHIYEPSHGREVRVRGYDVLHRLRKRQPVRAHVQITMADLIKEIVGDLSIDVDAPQSGPLWQRLIQFRQSDFEMVSEITERCGFYFTLRNNTLHVTTLEGFGDEVPLKLGETLLEVRIEVNGDSACRSVSTTGWDPLRVEQHEGKANAARLGLGIGAGLEPGDVGGTGERTIIDQTLGDDVQAEAIAQGELDLRAAREVTLRGVTEGDPKLRPGTPVNIENIAPPLAGRYVLTSVDHTFDSVRGFVSTISTAPPPLNQSGQGSVAALGIVTQIDDPEGLGRVRVKLPTYRDIETDWMGVVTSGAGKGKGLLALPDVNDTVLVLLPSGDPANGVVLGGLYGMLSKDGWDWGVDKTALKGYTLRTPDGQRIQLNDSKHSIRFENKDGSYMEMSPDTVRLHSVRDLQIDAPNVLIKADKGVVIKAQTVDFQGA